MDETNELFNKELQGSFIHLLQAYIAIANQYSEDMEAIRHELETVWEAINELQGIDPERAGEPDADN